MILYLNSYWTRFSIRFAFRQSENNYAVDLHRGCTHSVIYVWQINYSFMNLFDNLISLSFPEWSSIHLALCLCGFKPLNEIVAVCIANDNSPRSNLNFFYSRNFTSWEEEFAVKSIGKRCFQTSTNIHLHFFLSKFKRIQHNEEIRIYS